MPAQGQPGVAVGEVDPPARGSQRLGDDAVAQQDRGIGLEAEPGLGRRGRQLLGRQQRDGAVAGERDAWREGSVARRLVGRAAPDQPAPRPLGELAGVQGQHGVAGGVPDRPPARHPVPLRRGPHQLEAHPGRIDPHHHQPDPPGLTGTGQRELGGLQAGAALGPAKPAGERVVGLRPSGRGGIGPPPDDPRSVRSVAHGEGARRQLAPGRRHHRQRQGQDAHGDPHAGEGYSGIFAFCRASRSDLHSPFLAPSTSSSAALNPMSGRPSVWQ